VPQNSVLVRKQSGTAPREKITRRTAPDYRGLRHERRHYGGRFEIIPAAQMMRYGPQPVPAW
jgi:hypothetical protein